MSQIQAVPQYAEPSDKHSSTVREALKRLLDRRGQNGQPVYSQREVAKEIGYSSSSLSSYLAGKYNAASTRLELALHGWLRRIGEQLDAEVPRLYIQTTASEMVIETLQRARDAGEMVACIGKPGVGKTEGIEAWARQARAAGTRYAAITCNVTTTPASMLRGIARALGLGDGGSSSQLMERVQLELKSAPRLLILDEAQHLPLRCLEVARAINDSTRSGVALVGSDQLYQRLTRPTRAGSIELAQLTDRMYMAPILQAMTRGETARFAVTYLGEALDEDVQEKLYRLSGGSPRRLVRILSHARQLCADKQVRLSTEIVDEADALLFQKTLREAGL